MGHIWLIGMMGSGKTSVGAIIAEQLTRPLVDTDTLMMKTSGKTITQIFDLGEDGFRDLESSIVSEASNGPPSVISTGGGVILDEGNIVTMQSTGSVVLLTATISDLSERLRGSEDRPLWVDQDELRALERARNKAYREAAEFTVDTSNLDTAAVAQEVLQCVDM